MEKQSPPTKYPAPFTYVMASPEGKKLGFITDTSSSPPRRRIFVGLVSATAIILCLLLLLGWVIPYIGFGNIHASVPVITGALLIGIVSVIVWATLDIVLQTMTGRNLPGASRLRGVGISFFLPAMESVGKLFGFSVADVRRSFIKVSNQATLEYGGRIEPEQLLILIPHCIQRADCDIRINHRIDACKECGKCPIADILALRRHYNVLVAVATGGSIARRTIVQLRPKFIIAVACERDLASGIQDAYPRPVFGILNSRPEGPCINTLVSASLLEDAIRFFVTPDSLLGKEPLFSADSAMGGLGHETGGLA